MLEVPEVVRRKAITSGATAWLDGLPDLVAGLEADWGITVGAPYPNPTEAYVAAVELDDGTPAVLKLLHPPRSRRRPAGDRHPAAGRR